MHYDDEHIQYDIFEQIYATPLEIQPKPRFGRKKGSNC